MTFALLRELHAVIGASIDEIEGIYRNSSSSSSPVTSEPPSTPTRSSSDSSSTLGTATTTTPKGASFANGHGYVSPPPSPSVTHFPSTPFFRPRTPSNLDFPSLDAPFDATSAAEQLTSHPVVLSAINKIIAATGQMSLTVQSPFLALCDASMGYHLPSCLRLFEASHIVELLNEAGPDGLHTKMIAEKTGVEKSKIAHILRLLASHHLLREVTPNVFANNRISSSMDTGKSYGDIMADPEAKYRGTNGISAFVGMCTDELQKSSAYMAEAYLLNSNARLNGQEPTHAPFNFAFGCEGVGFFSWLEGEGIKDGRVNGPGRERALVSGIKPSNVNSLENSNRFRLERFGTAMTGTDSWEVPGAVLNGFDWHNLPRGSIVVDVGGGIGSTSMFLAHAFSNPNDDDALGLRFIIQDRGVVVDMGEKAWREKCPVLLESGVAEFQVHDFFTPQPIRHAAVYFLRVILHDWPDDFARRILLLLREAAAPETKLVLADFVLPLACTDDLNATDDEQSLAGIIGAETTLAPAPLLPNLGKASAHAYWMDMTMQTTFNGQERTLREIITLCASAGWTVIKVTKAPGSLFGHTVAIPGAIPPSASTASALLSEARDIHPGNLRMEHELIQRANSRCGTPTLGSRTELPSFEESRTRFGGRFIKGIGRRVGLGSAARSGLSKLVISSPQAKKKRPSPLSVSSVSSPILISTSPRNSLSLMPLSNPEYTASTNDLRIPPVSPVSPRQRTLTLSPKSSFAKLHRFESSTSVNEEYNHMPSPSISPPSPGVQRTLTHFASQVQLSSSPPVAVAPRPPSSPVTSRSRGFGIPRRASLAQLVNHSSPSSSTSSSPVPPVPDLPASYAAQPPRSPFLRRKDSDRGAAVMDSPFSLRKLTDSPVASLRKPTDSPVSSRKLMDSPLSRKKSEGLLGLGRHGRNRSGSFLRALQIPGSGTAGRKIAFGDAPVSEEDSGPSGAEGGKEGKDSKEGGRSRPSISAKGSGSGSGSGLGAPATIEKAVRYKSRPASPF